MKLKLAVFPVVGDFRGQGISKAYLNFPRPLLEPKSGVSNLQVLWQRARAFVGKEKDIGK
jgi:hypothetical protein